MDFIKNAVSSAGGNKQGSGSTANNGQKEDYVDKAFDFVSKKAGRDFDRNTDEKITDGARSAYEKITGSKVSDKVSN